jgi:D-glycero-alpha-D-manno-heptose 1-phosphate guanylyltransferase
MNTAIILAGGFGTRLKHVVSNVPKPMAPINGMPFLQILLDSLEIKGIKKAILATGYKHEIIAAHFGFVYKEIDIIYSVENEPLGTGGAIANAFKYIDTNIATTLVINGDSYFNLDLEAFEKQHRKSKADISIALKKMADFDRYGVVEIEKSGKIIQFKEKQYTSEGLINTGCYLINYSCKNILTSIEKPFSFEEKILENNSLPVSLYGVEQEGYFIDIGIPEDYKRAADYFV